MAQQLKALYEAEIMEKVMFGVPIHLDDTRLQTAATAAVDAFFRIHGGEHAPA